MICFQWQQNHKHKQTCMEFHEKSLELNITHELLNLADSWYWFLIDIPLWRYWRPRYKLPFLKQPKSTCGGFHITTEGKNDPSGNAGGGYDVRIKTGKGNHLLFIQYKKGELIKTNTIPSSEFAKPPHEHYKFKINSTSTNQHFVLRDLIARIGSQKGNAVVYAFPLIEDMEELERYAGKLIRRTKFVSVNDIDLQAAKDQVLINRNEEHSFKICKINMNRCEMNLLLLLYIGPDQTSSIITDVVVLGFQKIFKSAILEIKENFENYELYNGYIHEGLQQSFFQYLRFLMHYFEVKPGDIINNYLSEFFYLIRDEFSNYKSTTEDIMIFQEIVNSLAPFFNYINNSIAFKDSKEKEFYLDLPTYTPKVFTAFDKESLINFKNETDKEILEDVSYLSI